MLWRLRNAILVEKKNAKNDFEKSLHFEGGGGAKANLEKVYILNFFFYDGFPKYEQKVGVGGESVLLPSLGDHCLF